MADDNYVAEFAPSSGVGDWFFDNRNGGTLDRLRNVDDLATAIRISDHDGRISRSRCFDYCLHLAHA